MIICPWCGTSYLAFQPNCKNCGGPLPTEEQHAAFYVDQNTVMPPLPPRSIPSRYAVRLTFATGTGIVGLVFSILGVVYSIVGVGLALVSQSTSLVGRIFFLLSIPFLCVGLWLLIRQYRSSSKIVQVLRDGVATEGKITDVQQNFHVSINGRNPWIIHYQFSVNGEMYQGKVSTLNQPNSQLLTGQLKPVSILYLPNEPKWNSIYPHP